jgi:tRNA-splicing ligase RtcB
MLFCQDYALENRRVMALETASVIASCIGDPMLGSAKKYLYLETMINRHHNHAENKDGIVVHRKGATHAEKNMWGVIPGNMIHGSYIVVGKGNEESMSSSSHGAGRAMSRRKAKENISVEDFKLEMEMSGIACIANESTLDEAPSAYKNPDLVMESQTELVSVANRLYPIICVKAGKSDDGD